jgi:hypothetical protein
LKGINLNGVEPFKDNPSTTSMNNAPLWLKTTTLSFLTIYFEKTTITLIVTAKIKVVPLSPHLQLIMINISKQAKASVHLYSHQCHWSKRWNKKSI